jgi:hypothetical protein
MFFLPARPALLEVIFGRLLIGAEMQAPSEQQVFTDAENILDTGFAS